MTIRIFKREYSEHNPDLISGYDLLELAKKEIKKDIDFDGEINTIDEAFEYYNAFESIQECDLIGELRCLPLALEIKDKQISELESENKRYREALKTFLDSNLIETYNSDYGQVLSCTQNCIDDLRSVLKK